MKNFFKQLADTTCKKNFSAPTTKLVDKTAAGKIFNATATTKIKNYTGLHAEPSAKLTTKAQSFQSDVRFKAKGKTVDAKSILSVVSMALRCGDEITVLASGRDAQQAVDELVALIDSGFGFPINKELI